MPSGLPTAAQLLGDEISFFSLDTNIIERCGFKFDDGPLSALPFQRPHWIGLQLTEIVVREVTAHRMKAVADNVRGLETALKNVGRHTDVDLSRIADAIAAANVEAVSDTKFKGQIKRFLSLMDGGVLPIDGPKLAKDMFARYFDVRPPFEVRKKDEFPDAAALLVLEQFAKKKGTKGILVSGDKGGWNAFASQSDFLYCVKTLEDFTSIFVSTGKVPSALASKIEKSLDRLDSPIASAVLAAVHEYVNEADWEIGDLYSGFDLRLEAGLVNASVKTLSWGTDNIRIWVVESAPTTCVAEFSVSVDADLTIDVEFFKRDWVDKDEVFIGSNEFERQKKIEVDLFLTCSGNLLTDPVSKWNIQIGCAGGGFSVDVGEVEPDFGDYEE